VFHFPLAAGFSKDVQQKWIDDQGARYGEDHQSEKTADFFSGNPSRFISAISVAYSVVAYSVVNARRAAS
jgi:hypothetical protein